MSWRDISAVHFPHQVDHEILTNKTLHQDLLKTWIPTLHDSKILKLNRLTCHKMWSLHYPIQTPLPSKQPHHTCDLINAWPYLSFSAEEFKFDLSIPCGYSVSTGPILGLFVLIWLNFMANPIMTMKVWIFKICEKFSNCRPQSTLM